MAEPRTNISQPARGDRFIGRRRILQSLMSDVLATGNNVSIVGFGRVGKSSIGYKLMDCINESKQCMALRFDLQGYTSSEDILREMSSEFRAASVRLSGEQRDREETESVDSAVTILRRSIRSLAKRDVRVFCIVDEFDYIKRLREADVFCRILRSFANETGSGHFGLVTVSRRPVSHLEAVSADISNLDGILKKVYVKCFDFEDMKEVVERLCLPRDISPNALSDIINSTGRHPFFLSMFFDRFRKDIGIESALSEFQRDREEHYELLDRFMSEIRPSLLGSIASYVTGYRQGAREDLLLLERYGLINSEEELGFTISNEYAGYLADDRHGTNTTALWNQVERKLRDVLSEMMDRKYGPSWRSDSRLLASVLSDFERLERRRRSAAKIWGPTLAANPLSFCYPAQYWEIIKANRVEMKSYFGDSEKWEEHFNRVIMIRNPTAHNWLEHIDRSKVSAAEASLKEILRAISPTAKPNAKRSN